MFGPIKNVVFDLDGTLINSMPQAVLGLKKAVRDVSGYEMQDEELSKEFGKSPEQILAKFLSPEELKKSLVIWAELCSKIKKEDIPAFDGIPDVLRSLKENSIGIGIFTGRDRDGSLRFLELHNWLNTYVPLECIRCGDDGFKAKPSGEALIDLLKACRWNPQETLFVGDSPKDAIAGIEAGVKTAAALWDDFFGEGTTQRARYKTMWMSWEGVDVNVRLPSPLALKTWMSAL